MHHVAIEGGLGAGKTFLMSLLAHFWREEAMKKGVNVELFSNYELKDSTQMIDYTDWYKVAEADTSIICWDEAQVNFDNRGWSKFENKISTEIAMYGRKLRCIQMYAMPNIGMIDSRIRNVIEINIKVRKDSKGFHLFFYDFQTKEFLRKVFLPKWKVERVFKLDLYDTYSFVRSVPLPNNEKQAKEFWDTLETIHRKKMGRIMKG